MSLGRILGIVGGVVALAGSVLLLLVAVDARAWSDAFRDDDAVFRVEPKQAVWDPAEHAPFGISRRVLGLDDDLALRRAIQRFQLEPKPLHRPPTGLVERCGSPRLAVQATRMTLRKRSCRNTI